MSLAVGRDKGRDSNWGRKMEGGWEIVETEKGSRSSMKGASLSSSLADGEHNRRMNIQQMDGTRAETGGGELKREPFDGIGSKRE
jgi:hypothetical protein